MMSARCQVSQHALTCGFRVKAGGRGRHVALVSRQCIRVGSAHRRHGQAASHRARQRLPPLSAGLHIPPGAHDHQRGVGQVAELGRLGQPGCRSLQARADAVVDDDGRIGRGVARPWGCLQETDDRHAIERGATRQGGIDRQLSPDSDRIWRHAPGAKALYRGQHLAVVRPAKVTGMNEAQ